MTCLLRALWQRVHASAAGGIARAAAACCAMTAAIAAGADEPRAPLPAAAADVTAPAAAVDLSREQQQIAAKYQRFEEVLVRMAELTAPTDPKRAALLRKAVAESKHQLIGLQLDKLAELLEQDRLSVALTNQGDVSKDLNELLNLLLTEEREKGIKDERARIKEQIRRVTELINKERQLQGQTFGGGEMQRLAGGQSKIAEDAARLAAEMKSPEEAARDAANDKRKDADAQQHKDDDAQRGDKSKDSDHGEGSPQNGNGKPSDGAPQEGESSRAKQPGGEGESKDGKPQEKSGDDAGDNQGKDDAEKNAKDGDQSKDADKDDQDRPAGDDKESGKNQDGQSKKGQTGKPQQGEGQPQEGDGQEEQDQDQNAQQNGEQNSSQSARKRVEAAQEKMQAARQKLEKAQREGAVEEQEAAIRELEQAKAELEEILRQLREEELERMLAMLEGRFRKMLQAQIEVYEGTKRVDHKPQEERDRNDEIEAGRLSRKESQISLDAEQALNILREEGSAVAFPEAVEQMREDMDQIVGRLARTDVGDITQSIEEDVIAALEEMIDALQKAQQDLEKQKQQQQGPPPEGQPEDPPLIDTLAELKMIRSLQMRINMRTKRLARLVEGDVGQTDKPELLEQLQRLAEREESVFRVTHDIVTGKNR